MGKTVTKPGAIINAIKEARNALLNNNTSLPSVKSSEEDVIADAASIALRTVDSDNGKAEVCLYIASISHLPQAVKIIEQDENSINTLLTYMSSSSPQVRAGATLAISNLISQFGTQTIEKGKAEIVMPSSYTLLHCICLYAVLPSMISALEVSDNEAITKLLIEGISDVADNEVIAQQLLSPQSLHAICKILPSLHNINYTNADITGKAAICKVYLYMQ